MLWPHSCVLASALRRGSFRVAPLGDVPPVDAALRMLSDLGDTDSPTSAYSGELKVGGSPMQAAPSAPPLGEPSGLLLTESSSGSTRRMRAVQSIRVRCWSGARWS